MSEDRYAETRANARRLLPDAKRARAMTKVHIDHEGDRLADPSTGERLWDSYEEDASTHLEQMERIFPGSKAMYEKCKAERKKAGGQIVFVELGGPADGSNIGADITINAVLQADIGRPAQKNQIIVPGDLTRTVTRRKLLEVLRHYEPISLMVFQPVGAAAAYAGNAFAYEQIGRLLRESAPLLATYGQMSINIDRIRNRIPIERMYEGFDVIIEEAPSSTTFKEGMDEWSAMNVFRVYRKEALGNA